MGFWLFICNISFLSGCPTLSQFLSYGKETMMFTTVEVMITLLENVLKKQSNNPMTNNFINSGSDGT